MPSDHGRVKVSVKLPTRAVDQVDEFLRQEAIAEIATAAAPRRLRHDCSC
jgi:hypothetical protein